MTEQPSDEQSQTPAAIPATVTNDGDKIVVVTPNGMGVAEAPTASERPGTDRENAGQDPKSADPDPDETAADADDADGPEEDDGDPRRPTDLVEQPAKVMRIGSMVKSLLEEVRGAPLDDAGRAHLAQVHARSIAELKDGLAPELVEELDRIALPFSDDNPTDAELRIAQAQLVGWLEGLFHGIQTALVAQQMAAQAQLQQMRQLPPGMQPGAGPAAARPGSKTSPPHEGTGQYL